MRWPGGNLERGERPADRQPRGRHDAGAAGELRARGPAHGAGRPAAHAGERPGRAHAAAARRDPGRRRRRRRPARHRPGGQPPGRRAPLPDLGGQRVLAAQPRVRDLGRHRRHRAAAAPGRDGCFDTNRISITGVSNGAGFTARMGCELPTTFAAVIPVAAGYKALDPCPGPRARRSSTSTGPPTPSCRSTARSPTARATSPATRRRGRSATAAPRTRGRARRGALVTRFTYTGCDGGTRVERVRLTGTDHGWPRTKLTGRLPSSNPSHFDATTEVLRFIRDARRPAS